MLTLAQQHIYGFEGTTAKIIFVTGFTGLAVLAMMVLKMPLRNWLLGAILFITSIAPSLDLTETAWNPTWFLPLALNRPTIHLVLGVLLSLLVVMRGQVSLRSVSPQSVFVFVLAVYCGMLRFIHEGPIDGLQAVGFALGTIPAVAIAADLSARSYEGCVGLLKMMMGVSVAWAVCASIQFVINPAYLVSVQGRFYGLLGNAQHTAAIVSVWSVVALWLFLHERKRLPKLVFMAVLAINLLFLVWTGSRTGALMFVIGLTGVLYSRLGKAIALLPLAALLFWGLAALADALQIGANLQRLVSTEDTRQEVWQSLLRTGLENPLIGVGFMEARGSENSFLLAFAAYGLIALLLTIALTVFTMWQCGKMLTWRRHLPPEHRSLLDLVVAFCLMYFGGAFFEGYIHARSFSPQIFLMIFAAMGVLLREEIFSGSDQAELPEYDEISEQPLGDMPLEHT